MVRDVIARVRSHLGWYEAREWERLLTDSGVDVTLAPLPRRVRAVVDGDIVLIQESLTAEERAWSALHEAGHLWLHAGDRQFWLTRPQGHITVAKFERQANDFALLFPTCWEIE